MKCSECTVNDAKFQASNGDETSFLCGPDFADWLVDLVISNATVTFRASDPHPNQLQTVKVV